MELKGFPCLTIKEKCQATHQIELLHFPMIIREINATLSNLSSSELCLCMWSSLRLLNYSSRYLFIFSCAHYTFSDFSSLKRWKIFSTWGKNEAGQKSEIKKCICDISHQLKHTAQLQHSKNIKAPVKFSIPLRSLSCLLLARTPPKNIRNKK